MLLHALLEVPTPDGGWTQGFKSAIRLGEVRVHVVLTGFTGLRDRGVRPDEAGWGFARDIFHDSRLGIEIRKVNGTQHFNIYIYFFVRL